MNEYILTAIFFICSSILLYVIFKDPIVFGKYLNLIDYPNSEKHKKHKIPAASVGGLIIYIVILNYILISLSSGLELASSKLLILFILINFGFWFGIIDDLFKISAGYRLISLSLILLILSINFEDFSISSFYSDLLSKEIETLYVEPWFTIICYIVLYNIFNMLDGINGLLITYVLGCLLIISISISFPILLTVLIITLLILLLYNLNNKIFLGNNGSAILSLTIAFLTIEASKNNKLNFSDVNILILFFLPFIDFIRLFFQRFFSKRNPMKGDNNHYHHIVLKDMNFIKWGGALIILFIAFYFIINHVNSLIFFSLLLILYIYTFWRAKNK